MRAILALGVLTVALTTAGCGSNEEPQEEEPPMKVEDTVFGDLIGTQDKARDRSNAAVELHRDALEKRLDADEGAAPDEDVPPEE
jgi:hypothetical protein